MVAVARPSTEVRAMRREDLDAVVAIEHASYEFPWSAGIFRDCLQGIFSGCGRSYCKARFRQETGNG